MFHAVLFAAMLTKTLFKSSQGGKAIKKVKAVAAVARSEDRIMRLQKLRQELEMGLNRREDADHVKRYGTVESLYPARILAEDLPAGFEQKTGIQAVGSFVFKPTEWNDLWSWIDRKIEQSHGDLSNAEGRDGRWLLSCGRKRWENELVRKKAEENSRKDREFWLATGMWREQES